MRDFFTGGTEIRMNRIIIYLLNCNKTSKNKKFLHLDYDINRIVVFTTEKKNLEDFQNSNIVICDVTFKSAPSNFLANFHS